MISTILPAATAPSKAVRPHDPLVCGLSFESDCAACRTARMHAEREFHERDGEARERWRMRVVADQVHALAFALRRRDIVAVRAALAALRQLGVRLILAADLLNRGVS